MSRIALSSVAALATLFACQSEPAAEPKAPAPAEKAEKAKPAAPAPELNFAVRIVPEAAKKGEPSTTIVEVKPKAGYKMNKEFPSRLVMAAADGVKPVKAELGKGDAEVTEEVLRFKVAYTADKAGKVDLAAKCDFSVCNESTCKLVRDHDLTWAVVVK